MTDMRCVAVGERNRQDSVKIAANSQNSAGKPAIDFAMMNTIDIATAVKLALNELHTRGDHDLIAEIVKKYQS